MNWGYIDRYAKSLIKEAGHRIRVSFFNQIHIDSKTNANDLVTNIDREIEQFFIERIHEDFPHHKIVGEEGYGDKITDLNGITWILDPIDGTTNFIYQKRNFAISLGIYMDGVGILGYVYDVVRDDFYHAKKGEGAYFNDERLPKLEPTSINQAMIGVSARWAAPNNYLNHEKIIGLILECRGTRSYGSASLEMAYVATGRLDCYMSMRLSPWDIAGGLVIAEEVGAIATNLHGTALHLLGQESFIIARPQLHSEILTNYIRFKQ